MLKFLRFILLSYFILAAAGALVWLVLWKAEGMKIYSVQTGSMAPVLQPGDLAISVRPQLDELQVGDIISYKSRASDNMVTHRIYSIDYSSAAIITKGDRLARADSAVKYPDITAKTIKVVPYGGRAADFIKTPAGLILLVYLPALFIAARELQRLAAHYSYKPYQSASG